MGDDWVTVSYRREKDATSSTIIAKLTDGTDLESVPRGLLANAVMNAAGLNSVERRDTYFKPRPRQNLTVIDTYRKSAKDKILAIKQVSLEDGPHPFSAYTATPENSCKGVVHGISAETTEQELRQHLESEQTRILSARPMGRSNTILVTFEGLRVPHYVLFHRTAMRCYPHRPRSILCLNCMVIGHKSEVCPKKGITVTCPNCGGVFAANPGLEVAHSCETRCYNCNGEHPATDPACKARTAADENARRLANTRRKRLIAAHNAREREDKPARTHEFLGKWLKHPPDNRRRSPSLSRRNAKPDAHEPRLPQRVQLQQPPEGAVSGNFKRPAVDQPLRPPQGASSETSQETSTCGASKGNTGTPHQTITVTTTPQRLRESGAGLEVSEPLRPYSPPLKGNNQNKRTTHITPITATKTYKQALGLDTNSPPLLTNEPVQETNECVPPPIQMETDAASGSAVPPISVVFTMLQELRSEMNVVKEEQLRTVEAIIEATHRRLIETTIDTIALRVIDTVVARLSERFEERINDIEARIGIMPKRRAIESSAPEASHSPKDE